MTGGRYAAAAVSAAALAGCGGGGTQGDVSWAKTPLLIVPRTLPGDRILQGRLRNRTNMTLELRVANLSLLDRKGRRIPISAQFIQTFAHGLIFPDLRARPDQPLIEQQRIGVRARIRPGDAAPVTVSWHQPPGRAPARLSYGKGTLAVPPDSRAQHGRG